MKSYSLTTQLKLGLVVGAILIAVASLAYSHRLIDRLRDREQILVRLWASALEEVSRATTSVTNPYRQEFRDMLEALYTNPADVPATVGVERARAAIRWAETMPPSPDLSFILDNVLQPIFDIPAIIADGDGNPILWHNVPVDSTFAGLSAADSARVAAELQRIMTRMEARYEPIEMQLVDESGNTLYRQRIFYGDSRLVKALRIFPFVQLLFGSLFILVGYVGFSHVRKSEQSNLWVGMAKEAAHQLGTPISSLMGWIALLRSPDTSDVQRALAVRELEVDAERLKRVTNRFSDIGSMPKLAVQPVRAVLQTSLDYIERRLPREAGRVELSLEIDGEPRAALNAELFAWVVENVLKNALDAMENRGGSIAVNVHSSDRRVVIDIADTGKGIDRRQWKNVFRPGYSTKKRGWGLGLSLAKRIVEDYHGGTIFLVRSRLGEGSTFRIELPLAGDQSAGS